MFSPGQVKKQPKKQYFTLVLDHAICGDKHVVFELGAGICGSGFPDYDYYMQDKVAPIVFNNVSYPCKSLMARKMMESLAKKVKYLYVVNASMEMLLDKVGLVWLHEAKNIRYFQSLKDFCLAAQKDPSGLKDCALVVDRMAESTLATEQDYAVALENMGINIPVINAGAYKVFDEKVSFTTLFTGNDEAMLPKTWLVDIKSYQSILEEIEAHTATQFILKLPIMSHARDTIIAEKSELKCLVEALIAGDGQALSRLKLKGTARECIQIFLDRLTSQRTFLIREMLLPDPVQVGQHQYRCAARSVFTVVYDTANKTLEHIECLDSYWQRPMQAYAPNQAISHANLITADMPMIKGKRLDGSVAVVAGDADDALTSHYSDNCLWTEEQKNKHMPALLEIAKTVVRGIVKQDLAECIADLAKHPNPVVARRMSEFVHSKSVGCASSETFARLLEITNNPSVFLARQFVIILSCLNRHQQYKAVPAHIIKACGATLDNDTLDSKMFFEQITPHVMTLPETVRNQLVIYAGLISPTFAASLAGLIKLASETITKATDEQNGPAKKAYVAKNYRLAIKHWEKLLESLLYFAPESEAVLSSHNNIAACYRELGNTQQAVQHLIRAVTIARSMQRMDLAEKYNEKLAALQDNNKTQTKNTNKK